LLSLAAANAFVCYMRWAVTFARRGYVTTTGTCPPKK